MVWKGIFLPLVSFVLSLIIHYCFLLPNTASKAAICCPVFLVDLADKYNYVFPHGFMNFLLTTALTDIQLACRSMAVCLVTTDATVGCVWTPGLA